MWLRVPLLSCLEPQWHTGTSYWSHTSRLLFVSPAIFAEHQPLLWKGRTWLRSLRIKQNGKISNLDWLFGGLGSCWTRCISLKACAIGFDYDLFSYIVFTIGLVLRQVQDYYLKNLFLPMRQNDIQVYSYMTLSSEQKHLNVFSCTRQHYWSEKYHHGDSPSLEKSPVEGLFSPSLNRLPSKTQ